MGWRQDRAQDYVHSQLFQLLNDKEAEEMRAAEKSDPALAKYDAVMKRLSKARNALAQRHSDESAALAKKQEPIIQNAIKLLGGTKEYEGGWSIRDRYLQKTFPAIREKYKTLRGEIKGALLLHDQKNLAAFLAEWTAKINGK